MSLKNYQFDDRLLFIMAVIIKLADDRNGWRLAVCDGVRSGEEKRNLQLENKRTQRKERQQTADSNQPSNFACNINDPE